MHGFKAFAFLALAFCATAKGDSTECSNAVDCQACTTPCKVCTIGKLATCSKEANCTDVKFGQTSLTAMSGECSTETPLAMNYVPGITSEKDCKEAVKRWCLDKETKKIGACVQAVKSCAEVDLADPESLTTTSSTSKPSSTKAETEDPTKETDATVAETTGSTVSLSTAAALVAAALAYVV